MTERGKDPKRQLQGKLSRAKGKQFEDRLDASFAYYRQRGFAIVEKTPEPMRVLRSIGNGRFIACFEKKAQPDYKGTVKGGRTVIFEAKFTSAVRMEQGRVLQIQAEIMTESQVLGARCSVIVGFPSGAVYNIPWDVWSRMKEYFGRKYVTEADLSEYRVRTSWNGTLLLLG